MAKDRKKLQHIHSSVPDKQPTVASLEVGEIAVNNAQNQEFISIKNSNDKVVRFSSDGQIINWMERKEVFPYSGVVDNVNLDTNRSNIEIKFNQVVSSATTKHNIVNGAKDIDDHLVNPTTDGGLTNGAGFAIDMSRYAMIDANPSFSSVTISGTANISGATRIDNNLTVSGDTNISGNTTIGGDTYLSGKTYFNNVCGDIDSNELSDAICEVFRKSVVTITKDDNPSDTNLIAKYKLYQNDGAQIGDGTNPIDIDIPKVENKEIIENNTDTSRGVDVDVWTDATTDKINISANTTVQVVTDGNGTITSTTSNAVNSLYSYKLTLTHNGLENAEFDPFKASSALTLPHSALTATYEATSDKSGSVTFNTSADTAISIPTCVNHLNRHNITFKSGSTALFDNQTYDPGKDCANSAETINIPTSITHLKEWDDSTGCLEVAGCVKATNFYQTSDINYKENIREPKLSKVVGAHYVPIVQFNFKDDAEKTDVYGVIAQEVEKNGLQEIVLSDEFGKKSVDYTSLMMLKIAYLENENRLMRTKLSELDQKINELEGKTK